MEDAVFLGTCGTSKEEYGTQHRSVVPENVSNKKKIPIKQEIAGLDGGKGLKAHVTF